MPRTLTQCQHSTPLPSTPQRDSTVLTGIYSLTNSLRFYLEKSGLCHSLVVHMPADSISNFKNWKKIFVWLAYSHAVKGSMFEKDPLSLSITLPYSADHQYTSFFKTLSRQHRVLLTFLVSNKTLFPILGMEPQTQEKIGEAHELCYQHTF